MNRRLIALENENRLLRRIGGSGLLLVLAACLVGQAGPKEASVPEVLRARRIEILDPAGVRRVTLGTVDLGESVDNWGMDLLGSEGHGGTTIGCRKDSSTVLWMRNPKKRAQVSVEFGVSPEGMPHLSLHDGEQRSRIRARVLPEGPARISMLREDGTAADELTNREK